MTFGRVATAVADSRGSTLLVPDFFVVGAIKAGTTALYHYLGQHPGIALPHRQEPNFFAFKGQVVDFRGPGNSPAPINRTSVTDSSSYEQLYGRVGERVVGDISPVYLYWPATVKNMRKYAPNAKIIMILRNPIDRAFSSYMHLLRDDREPLGDFRAALDAEPVRLAENWGFLWRYKDVGRYAKQVQRYLDAFPEEQILVLLYDELRQDAAAVCRRIQGFVGVDPHFTPDVSGRFNMSGVPRSRFLHEILDRQSAIKSVLKAVVPDSRRTTLQKMRVGVQNRNLERQPILQEDRAYLRAEFEDEVADLEDVLKTSLHQWIGP